MSHTALLVVFLLFAGICHSQDIIPTKGKEFWVGFMENFWEGTNESLELFVTSNVGTTGTVTIPQQGWSQSFTVSANSTTSINIPNAIAEHYQNQLIEDRGIFVETQDTVSVFAVNVETFTADATKVLPVQALGTE
ncbi:MAG: hypothetical protein HKN32_08625, partial [Flavobacteriales bacterium]|nr:hypothetical protein [Flavobacteriales bacterium]